MSPPPSHDLAIETSDGNHPGEIALGRDGVCIALRELASERRHNLALVAVIDELLEGHGLRPSDLGRLHVSIGPGSFTGLRVAVATGRVLAMSLGLRLVAVPTVEVIARNLPADGSTPLLAVGLNTKRDRMYCGLFRPIEGVWSAARPASLVNPTQLLDATDPEPFVLLGDHPPPFDWPARVTLASSERARPSARHVLALGHRLAQAGRFTQPADLLPLYARVPEAQELWEARQKSASA